jgi:carboxymethylenebutenolidase
MIERQLDIKTADGATTTFVTHPERDGPHPVIVFLMDAPAIREELRDMARRFAAVGYYVMLPNLYYREGVMEIGPVSRDPQHPSRKEMGRLMMTLSIPMVLSDVDAMLDFAAADTAADTTRVGAVGYCMSGRFAICAGGHRPGQVKATASIYGVRLVTERDDSPHLVARDAPAEFYVACAQTDVYAPPEMVDELERTLKGANGEVERFPGTEHGFAFPQRPVYDKAAAERHWERLFSLFARNLTARA